jgi:hypothetical protein
MNLELPLSPNMRALLSLQLGRPLNANALYRAMNKQKNCEVLPINTIKRVLGQLKDVKSMQPGTAYAIARYLGYETWNEASAAAININQTKSGFRMEECYLNAFNIKPDTFLKIGFWNGNDIEIVRTPQQGIFEVTKVDGIKQLQEGDIISIGQFNHNSTMSVNWAKRGEQYLDNMKDVSFNATIFECSIQKPDGSLKKTEVQYLPWEYYRELYEICPPLFR